MSLRVLMAVLVVLGAAAALLFGATRGGSHPGSVQDGVRPPTLPVAPAGPAGTVVYGRAARTGPFLDDSLGLAGVSLRGPDRISILRGVRTCCPAWSGARSLLTIGIDATPGPLLGVVAVGSDTYRPLAFGGQSRGLIPGGWSASGRELAVSRLRSAAGRPAGVYVAQWGNDTFRLVLRTPPGRLDRVLSMSPDGSRVLLFRMRVRNNPGGDGLLYTAGLQTGHQGLVRLTPPHSYSWCCYFGKPASWSPDGREVTFAAFTPGRAGDASRSAVYVASADGSQVHRVTPWGFWTTSAQWSPTGGWIAFDRADRAGGNHDLVIERSDGAEAHIIATDSAKAGSCCAQWSSDGRFLIYEHGSNENHQALYLVNISGRPVPRRMTGSNGSYMSFVVTGTTRG